MLYSVGKGIFEENINGVVVGFKFGPYASSVTEEHTGKKISEVFALMFDVTKDDSGNFVSAKHTAYTSTGLIHYFYGGAVAYANKHRKEKPTIDEVSDWIEQMGSDRAIEIYSQSITRPNEKPPVKE